MRAAGGGGAARRPQQSGFIIGNNLNRNRFHQRPQPPLFHEILHEYGTAQLGKNLRRDAPGQKEATGGHHF